MQERGKLMGLPRSSIILLSEFSLHHPAYTNLISVLKSRPHDTDGGLSRMLEEAGQ